MEKPSFTKFFHAALDVTPAFNIEMEQFMNLVYYLNKDCHTGLSDILNLEFYFVYWYYLRHEDEIKEQNKRQEEQNKEQQKLYNQQMSAMQSGNYFGGMTMPGMPNLSNFKM